MTLKNKGFTLIELLVVIAIIALLSSVILASLNSARDKAANAAIKSNLNNVRSQFTLLCGDGSASCAGLCTHASIIPILNGAKANTPDGSTCAATVCRCATAAAAWAVGYPLKVAEPGGAYWCVDSTGVAGARTTNTGATACP